MRINVINVKGGVYLAVLLAALAPVVLIDAEPELDLLGDLDEWVAD